MLFPPGREEGACKASAGSEGSVDFHNMRGLLPWLKQSQYDQITREANPYEKPGSALRRILVQTDVYRRTAEDALSQVNPDLTIVYFEGTDTIGHIFAPYAPPKQPEVTQEDYERYHQVPENYFQRIDSILGEFISIAERKHARLVIASDHAFQGKEGRPTKLSSSATATAAKWHRNEGIFLVWGDGIRGQGGHALHGKIRQICATLIAITQLPRGTEIAGPPLVAATNESAIDYRQYFLPFVPRVAPSAKDSSEEIAKLRALGYIGSGESTAPRPAAARASTK